MRHLGFINHVCQAEQTRRLGKEKGAGSKCRVEVMTGVLRQRGLPSRVDTYMNNLHHHRRYGLCLTYVADNDIANTWWSGPQEELEAAGCTSTLSLAVGRRLIDYTTTFGSLESSWFCFCRVLARQSRRRCIR
jgi:hypothetical protein